MNKHLRKILFLGTVLALLAASTALALAKELGSLTISGPGISGTATWGNPDDMMKLQQSGFFDTNALAKPPANLGQGYTITAYLNLDGKIVPFVEMVYYPAESGPGYVHYTGRLNGDTLETVQADQWATLPTQAEQTFRDIAAANGVKFVPAISANPSASTTAAAAPLNAYVALAIMLVVLLGAALLNRRKAAPERRASAAD